MTLGRFRTPTTDLLDTLRGQGGGDQTATADDGAEYCWNGPPSSPSTPRPDAAPYDCLFNGCLMTLGRVGTAATGLLMALRRHGLEVTTQSVRRNYFSQPCQQMSIWRAKHRIKNILAAGWSR